MKKQAKGPKFSVGQVVMDKEFGTPMKIATVELANNGRYYYNRKGGQYGEARHERELRPLTVREAGPARGRKREA